MAINGINSYGMGFYNYQSSINNLRLSQAVSKNPKLQQYGGLFSSPTMKKALNPSMSFLKQYTSSMSGLMNAANNLKGTNASGVMNDYKLTSSKESVASVTEKFKSRDNKKISLNVKQLAQAQSNVSSGVKASDAAKTSMNFTVKSKSGLSNVQVSSLTSDGRAKTNRQMLQEAASQINKGSSKVKASVVEKDGNVSLELTGEDTGLMNQFSVSGELGAAEGLDTAKVSAEDAKYSVTIDGKTTDYQSASNEVSVDFARIGVSLKGVGETTIQAGPDAGKVADAVGDLVDAYNSSLKLLNDNYGRGSGVERQLRSLVVGLGSEESLEKLGISINKDGTLKLDKEALKKSMKEDPKFTRDLISGSNGIADKAFNKAQNAMNEKSGSLISGDMSNLQETAVNDPINAFNMYSKGGAYMLTNYYALGMMMNYLV